MLAQTTKSYNIFLASEAFADRYSRKLVVSTVFDNGRGRQGRCTVLPLRIDCTSADEVDKAIHYVLGFTPVPNRELTVNLVHSFSGSVDLPPGHATVQLQYVSTVQNPATAPLRNYVRQNPM
jgi:hypothetical protein